MLYAVFCSVTLIPLLLALHALVAAILGIGVWVGRFRLFTLEYTAASLAFANPPWRFIGEAGDNLIANG